MATILICDQHGGFGVSRQAFLRLRELGCQEALDEPDVGEYFSDGSGPRKSWGLGESFGREVPRDHPALLRVFDELGQDAAGFCCHLNAVEIPDGVEWTIEEHDGLEWVAEKHRTWA